METQIGQMAASVPRQSDTLPGTSEPNPKGKSTRHVAAMNLRSGRQMQTPEQNTEKKEAEKSLTSTSLLDVDQNLVDVEDPVVDVEQPTEPA